MGQACGLICLSCSKKSLQEETEKKENNSQISLETTSSPALQLHPSSARHTHWPIWNSIVSDPYPSQQSTLYKSTQSQQLPVQKKLKKVVAKPSRFTIGFLSPKNSKQRKPPEKRPEKMNSIPFQNYSQLPNNDDEFPIDYYRTNYASEGKFSSTRPQNSNSFSRQTQLTNFYAPPQFTSSQNNVIVELPICPDRGSNYVALLGCGDSGKSTLLRQIEFLSCTAPALILDPEEQSQTKKQIIYAMVNDMKQTLSLMAKDNIPFSSSQSKYYANYLENYQADFHKEHVPFFRNKVPVEIKTALEWLWKDTNVNQSFLKYSKHGPGTWRYFDSFEKICDKNWIPCEQDKVLCKIRTVDVESVLYSGVTFCDIGGTHSSVSKWADCFVQSGFIVFLVSVVSTPLIFKQTVGLFRAACISEWFPDIPFLVLFTKADLFDVEHCETLLVDFYKNPSTNPQPSFSASSLSSVMKAMENIFIQNELECSNSTRSVYTYWISLIDGKQVRTVVEQVVSKVTKHRK